MSKAPDILVIDDEDIVTRAVVKICALDNYTVDVALNLKSAIEKISINNYSLVVCDIMMPDGNGLQILDELYRKNLNSAVIMMTGYSTVENAVNSLYKGAVDFIPKPFTVDELLSSVNRAINYQKIREKQRQSLINKNLDELLYVTCPAKYLRLGYSSWMFQEREGSVLIGVCDLFIKTIGLICEFEFQKVDEEIMQGISCASVKSSNHRFHKILSPVSGRIVEINENVKNNPNFIEKDPYFKGWIYRIIPTNINYETKFLIPCSSDRI